VKLRGKANGWCVHSSDAARRKILIHNKCRPATELRLTLHELLHAADEHKTEEWVNQASDDMAEILWKLGYRKLNNNQE
jgi:hypothetical protein